MVEQYLLAIISGIASGGVALGFTWYQWRQKRLARIRLKEMQEAAKAFSDQVAQDELYGFAIGKASVDIEILDDDGNARFRRSWEEIKVFKNFTLPEIPGKVSISAPGGSICKEPEFRCTEQHRHRLRNVAAERRDGNVTRYSVLIEPPWTQADGELSCLVVYEAKGAYLMSRAEVEEAYRNDRFKHEYHSFEVSYPIGELQLRVKFPDGFKSSSHDFGVFYGPGEVHHPLERARLVGCFDWDEMRNEATLSVSSPLIGFRYFISWLPAQ